MNMFLTLAYLFFIGSTLGWVAELLYRRFLSGANPERKWINPGFCVGPYVPLYGSGLCILYLLASIGEKNGVDTVGEKLLLFAGMALSMTAIEYIAGIVSLKFMHIRLWDYSKQWGNIQGLICPAFSVLWAAVSAVYYFCVHPYILDALDWLSRNLAFSFVIGFFFGVFTIDLVYSAKLVSRIRKFADEHDVVIKVENLKAHIRQRQEERREKYSFLFAYRSRSELLEHLRTATPAPRWCLFWRPGVPPAIRRRCFRSLICTLSPAAPAAAVRWTGSILPAFWRMICPPYLTPSSAAISCCWPRPSTPGSAPRP